MPGQCKPSEITPLRLSLAAISRVAPPVTTDDPTAGGLRPYDLAFVAGGGATTGEYYGYATVKTDRRAGDPPRLVASASKIRAALGWKPKYPDLHSIIETAWNWHQRQG